ncbi:MAG: hypothetical protein A3I71_04575 [Omnitrophica WOR_2 bacterium RIFCSPLOWO2_02_FULL_63_16]|nr:MAG: hypothetical protein A3I71_04575 [Omnitrophica WOR_2 bacterium RIFCSPLOWO2_02_FULL_63_16]OGX48783.1 MAG: hypothetical protein A3G88_06035 [Omnitrophica WOR_2 bacterium RIFCSPLOWO2_12_FULL_63_16]
MISWPRFENQGGFILPLSVLLVVVLSISGAGFMQHDYLERRMAINEVDNHGAFYLANAGIERARETFKVPDATFTWTQVLQGSNPNYPIDQAPEYGPAGLCGSNVAKNCVIAPFQNAAGDPVVAPDFPFAESFDDGQYEVRAFNDDEASGANFDTNGVLIFRARGTVRGEEKLLEVKAQAVSGLGLINCQSGVATECPEIKGGGIDVDEIATYLDGRAPALQEDLPYLLVPLTDPTNYYRNPANFGLTDCSASVADPASLDPEEGCFYYLESDVTITGDVGDEDGDGVADGAVVVTTGDLEIPGNAVLNNTILAAVGDIQLQGNILLTAPPAPNPFTYPAIISGGVVKGDNSVAITGNVFSSSDIDMNPVQVNGLLIAEEVLLQGNSTAISDEGNLDYYRFMPGFHYENGSKTTVVMPGSWQEIE